MKDIKKEINAIEFGSWTFWALIIIHHVFTIGEFDSWYAFIAYYGIPTIAGWLFGLYYTSKLTEEELEVIAERDLARSLKWAGRFMELEKKLQPYAYKVKGLIAKIKR